MYEFPVVEIAYPLITGSSQSRGLGRLCPRYKTRSQCVMKSHLAEELMACALKRSELGTAVCQSRRHSDTWPSKEIFCRFQH